MRATLALLLATLAMAGSTTGRAVPYRPYTTSDVTLTMSDGVVIAATLYEPSTAGRSTAILMLHGLGGKRQDLSSVATSFALDGFAVLTPDMRGHGESGGLVSIDGPREIQDVREEVAWLKARPELNGSVAGWGISLGGGAILRALVEGVRFDAVETLQTWTDLYSALAPQNLSKSGAVAQFLSSVPDDRLAPEVKAIRFDAIHSRNLGKLRAFGAVRSSRALLSRVHTPVFMLQGRRDFAFDLAQAKAGIRLLRGPKRLYVGDFGHAPSTFPGPDIAYMEEQMGSWFVLHLFGIGTPSPGPYQLAPEAWHGTLRASAKLPKVRSAAFNLPGSDSIGPGGKAVRGTAKTKARLETFGAGRVQVDAWLSGRWNRLVAVLSARPPIGPTIVVSEGGVNTSGLRGRHRFAIRMIDDATKIPSGSRLTVTIASSSTAQDPGNLLYLDVPMAVGARATIGTVTLSLPVLRAPVSK